MPRFNNCVFSTLMNSISETMTDASGNKFRRKQGLGLGPCSRRRQSGRATEPRGFGQNFNTSNFTKRQFCVSLQGELIQKINNLEQQIREINNKYES